MILIGRLGFHRKYGTKLVITSDLIRFFVRAVSPDATILHVRTVFENDQKYNFLYIIYLAIKELFLDVVNYALNYVTNKNCQTRFSIPDTALVRVCLNTRTCYMPASGFCRF